MQTNESSITVRHIGEQDLAAFRHIRLEALRREPRAFGSTLEDWIELSEAAWRQRLEQPVFLAFRADEPVGIMGLILHAPRKKAHRADLVMAYVRADVRGEGVADALLDGVIAFARGKGVLQIELTVHGTNARAAAFYRRRDFVEVGRIPFGYREDEGESDEVIMALRIA